MVGTATFTYDGDGNRVKKVENGQTTVYINQYYEKNTTSGVITTYYYLGGKVVALRNGTNLRYVHQDSLGSTSVVTNSSGAQYGYTRYYPYGSTRDSSGSLDTDKKFTGQRLDGTGLYYYGARYYDPTIGRFISADPVIPEVGDPQAISRYSYVVNNPLKYADPSGLDYVIVGGSGQTRAQMVKEYAEFLAYLGYIGERVILLPDIDPDIPLIDSYDVEPRIQQLMDVLASENLTDIKLIGFSEGAATVGTFLARLAKNPYIVSSSSARRTSCCRLAGMPSRCWSSGSRLALWFENSL